MASNGRTRAVIGVYLAGAATAIVAVGVIALLQDGGSTSDEAPSTSMETVVVVETTKPPSTSTTQLAPPVPAGWSRVPHDEAVFGADQRIEAVAAGGPGLVAVGHDKFVPDNDKYA